MQGSTRSIEEWVARGTRDQGWQWRRAVRMVSDRRLYLHVLDRRPVLFYESQYFTRQLYSAGRSPLNCLHTGHICSPLTVGHSQPYTNTTMVVLLLATIHYHPLPSTLVYASSERRYQVRGTPHQHFLTLIPASSSVALFAELPVDS